MKFTKMQGAGNDYIYINCFTEQVTNPEQLAVTLSDRHFGIGGDGIVLITPSDKADFRMKMYNIDGSEGMMCGNASRCIGKYVYDNGLTSKTDISLETKSGIKYLHLNVEDGKVVSADVDMGEPELFPARIPMLCGGDTFINQPLEINGEKKLVTAVSMGNPHAVVFTVKIDELDIEREGIPFEHHSIFPERVNTEFCEVIGLNCLKMRVWERGSGETLACGTGACATAVAAVLNGYAEKDKPIEIRLKGGTLHITWRSDNRVIMSGPAEKVFDGEIYL